MGEDVIESSRAEKNLGVLADEKQDMSQQRALRAQKTNNILGCIKRGMVSRSREMILLLYSSHVRFHLEHCIHILGPHHNRCGPAGAGPEYGNKDI